MNNLSNTGLEAIGIGVLTLIIGHVFFYLGIDKKKREEIKKYNKYLSLILFMIGVILHFIIEFSGLNKWYCDKQCVCNLKEISRIKIFI